jgi:nucleotide-binding universal stress UspA family protein
LPRTAERDIRAAPVDLQPEPTGEVTMKTILVSTDGSEGASEALDFGIDLARETGAELEVLAVKPPPILSKGGPAPPIFEIEEPGGAERIAARAAEKAAATGVHAHPHAGHGEPVDVIAAASESLHADLVVVGSRGLGGIAGALVGSVSHGLIKRAHVPVTVVPKHARDRLHA